MYYFAVYTTACVQRKNTIGKNTQQGFTLLELLVVILLMGILLTMSVGALLPQENNVRAEASKVIRAVMEARSRAILLNDQVKLELHANYMRIVHDKEILYTLALEDNVYIDAINAVPIENADNTIDIHHLGIIEESVIWLQQETQRITLYLPTIGTPVIFDDYLSLAAIHEELL